MQQKKRTHGRPADGRLLDAEPAPLRHPKTAPPWRRASEFDPTMRDGGEDVAMGGGQEDIVGGAFDMDMGS